jgi:hypothetical protein
LLAENGVTIPGAEFQRNNFLAVAVLLVLTATARIAPTAQKRKKPL